MLKTSYSNTDSFLMFMIIDENNDPIDNVVITKYYPYNVLHFFSDVEAYIEDYTSKLKQLVDSYEGKIDSYDALEKRTEAEFILYKAVNGMDE